MYDDPNLDEYAYYPPSDDPAAVGYDEMMGKVLDGRFVAIIDIPGRDAVYWCNLPVIDQRRFEQADGSERARIGAHILAVLGKRVHTALSGD